MSFLSCEKYVNKKRMRAWQRGPESVDATELYISVVTLQELEIGVLLVERPDAQQGATACA